MKRVISVLLIGLLVFGLCACGNSDSSNSESSKESSFTESGNGKSEVPDNDKSAEYIGTWKKSDIKTSYSSVSETADTKLDLKSDGTFVMRTTDADERGSAVSVFEGSYTVSGSDFTFDIKQMSVEGSLADGTQINSKSDMSQSFSGKLGSDGKLTCDLDETTTVVFEKI